MAADRRAPVGHALAGPLLAGISFVADLPGLGGLYWIPLEHALLWLGGLFNAWVLLVEIMR